MESNLPHGYNDQGELDLPTWSGTFNGFQMHLLRKEAKEKEAKEKFFLISNYPTTESELMEFEHLRKEKNRIFNEQVQKLWREKHENIS